MLKVISCDGSGKDCSEEASDIKCVMEHLKDSTPNPPTSLDGNNTGNKILWFIHTKECNDTWTKKNLARKKLHSLTWGQCTKMMKSKSQAASDHETMSEQKVSQC